MNTISDLINYLNVRESFSTKIDKLLIWGREKDVLGLYLRLGPAFCKLISDHEGEHLILDLENSWAEFEANRLDNDDAVLHV